MSEKRYLLTESEICNVMTAYADDGTEITSIGGGWWKKHEYRERTCKPIRKGTSISCDVCGSELHDPFRFCSGCGSKVAGE